MAELLQEALAVLCLEAMALSLGERVSQALPEAPLGVTESAALRVALKQSERLSRG